MKQIALPIDALKPDEAGSLILTDCNAMIVQAFDNRDSWPGRCAILTGPARSGKSLMGRYFTSDAIGSVIDDADAIDDEALFNAWNRAQEEQASLLLLSRFLPSDWDIGLPDLRSRLGAALHLEVRPPDDELVSHLLQKHLQDRGAALTHETLAYVCKRIDRSYAALENFAKRANAFAMAENKPIGLNIAKEILQSPC